MRSQPSADRAGDQDALPRHTHSVEPLSISGAVGYRLVGDLDASATPHLRRILRTDLADGNDVVLDLSSVTLLSSAVLAVLLAARRLAAVFGSSLRLQAPSSACARMFRLAGLHDALDVDEVVDLQDENDIPSPIPAPDA
jgi:anti-anti-sigma factor